MRIRFAVVAAATAFAVTLPTQAADFQVAPGTSFSISGFFGLGLKSASIGSSNRAGLSNELRIDDNTSRIFFSGTTKITDGWTVVYQVGSRFTTDVRPGDVVVAGTTVPVANATGWADDDTWAGISSPYGRLIFGKNSLYWPDTIGLPHLAGVLDAPGECYRIWDANGLGTFNILNQTPTITKTNVMLNSYVLGITRSRNVLRYDSPNMKGADVALLWSKNPVGGELWYPGANTPSAALGYARNYEDGSTMYARVRYNNTKGLTLHASMLDQKIQGGVYTTAAYNGPLDTKAFRFGAAYKLPIGLKVGVVFDSTEIENGVAGGVAQFGASLGSAKRTAFEIPISYTMGDHMFHLTYGKAGDVSSANASGANQLNLVWDYALTKKTFIGLYYTNLKNDTNGHYAPFLAGYSFGPTAINPAGVNGESWTQIGFNVQFWF